MVETPIIEQLLAYLPPDRAEAVLGGFELPAVSRGSVVFSDISGFTPLTEAVIARYGPRRGGEEFTDRLNAVYDALITEVERFGGSIIGFAGDAMAVWYAGDDGMIAVATALAMQRAMKQFARVFLPGGETVNLSMKVAVSSGTLRRFRVGDENIQFFDVIAGRVMERLAACEGAAGRGEVVVDSRTAEALGDRVSVKEWRQLEPGSLPESVAVVTELKVEACPLPQRPLSFGEDAAQRVRLWLVPDVYRRIISGQNVFLTELRPAAAVFTRFTGIDFENDPEAPAKLDTYIRFVQRIIARLEGVLVQLTIGEKGSYLYAAFGAPVAHDDDTRRALTAALEISRPPPAIAAIVDRVQIGVTRGTMRTGAYGGKRRRTYGVLGDDVNLSARLMAKAPVGEIYVSDTAARRHTGVFELISLEPIKVKGKQHPVKVFRLAGRRQTGLLGNLRAQLSATPMIGRVRERAHAVERINQALLGNGQVIAISAEAGMGKSRLLTEVMGDAAAAGFSIFAGDCQVLAREASYSVWMPIWRSFFQIKSEMSPEEALRRIETYVEGVGEGLRDRAPLLGGLVGISFPENELTRTLDGKVRRASMDGLVIECLRQAAKSAPLLFVLEECHWIDEASRHLLAAVIQAIARLPIALVLAHRPVEAGELLGPKESALDYVTTIELGDMPAEEARRLVEMKLAGLFGPAAMIPAALVELITARAAGNPFFIEEVCALLKSRNIDLSDARSLETLELPASLHSLVLGRIDQLSEDGQTTLKVASVIGRLFRVAMLWGVHSLSLDRRILAGHLAELRDRDVAFPEPVDGEDAYLFKHIVIQEVAYESLPYSIRATIHEAIGAYIEKVAGENTKPWIDLLAFHYDRSTREDKKRRYLVEAGDAALASYSLRSAISYFERALGLLVEGARIDVLLHLGEALELAGRWDEAFARYREAREEAENSGTPVKRAACAATIGDSYRKRGDFPNARTWLRRAHEENTAEGNELGVAHVLHLEGTLGAQAGEFVRATDLYHRALEIRERAGDEAGGARTLNNLGIVARSQGDVDTALSYYERSLAIRRRLNDKREIANSLNNLGFAYRYRREFDRAQSMLEESVKLNRAVGDRWSTANALTSLAELALDTNDAALAARCLQESISINRELGDLRALAFLLEAFGHLSRLRKQADTALLFFSATRALREKIGAPPLPADATRFDTVVDAVRQSLPAEACQHAEAQGRELPLAAVLDRAKAAFSEQAGQS